MKKIIAILVSIMLLFSFSACGEEEMDPGLNIDDDGTINFPIVDLPD